MGCPAPRKDALPWGNQDATGCAATGRRAAGSGLRSVPLRKLSGICVFQGSRDRMLRGGRDRFPSAVNRLGVGDGGSRLTLACSFHLQNEMVS